MHLAHARAIDSDDTAADWHVAVPRAASRPVTAYEPPARYGEGRRLSLPALALIALLHLVAIAALVKLDVIPVARHERPMKVFDVAEPPPPEDVPPPLVAQVVPPVAVPLVAPPPLVQTPAPAPQIQTVREAPPPQLAPVAVAAPPTPTPAPAAATIVSDRLAIVSKEPAPRYPTESRRKHEQGTVRLRVVVATDGRVKDIAVATSSGFARLDGAALDAVRQWRFQPKVDAGTAVEAIGFIPIPFKLG